MRFKRIAFILLVVFAGIFLLAFIFISPIAKYTIEKHSEEWTGRKITMNGLWINLFTGSVKISGFKLYENKSDKVFVGCNDFYIHVSLRKMLSSEYDIKEIKLTRPEVTIIQKGSHFNYDDLIKRFADTSVVKKKTPSEPAKFWVHNFAIDSAVINYSNTRPVTSVSLLNLNVSCPLIAYNEPAYSIKTAFDLKSGGNVNATIDLNSASLDYNLKLDLKKLNVAFLYPYLRDYIKINSMDGLVSSGIVLAGNFNKPADIATSGAVEIEQFAIVDTTGEKLTAVESFKMGVDSVNTKSNIYRLNTISISRPFIAFAMYKDGYNFERLMTTMATTGAPEASQEYSNIFQLMMAYVKEITEQYVVSNYTVQKLNIENGQMIFTDYTLEDKFQYNLDDMHVVSDNLSSKNERINVAVDSRLNKSGILKGALSVNPDGFRDMDVNCTVKDLLVSDMNPYSKYYVATPFMDGVLLYESNTTIRNNKLKSANNMRVSKIEVGKKVKNKTAYNLPIKLAVALLKDVHGNINLDIPVEGDLNDPKYKLGKVIWDVIKNIIVKAATAPFRLLANAFGGKEDDYKEIKFAYLQKELSDDQLRIANNMAKALADKPDLKAALVQVDNREEEMEQYALLETKKQYLGITSDSLTDEQAKQVSGVANTDSLFGAWVDKKLNTVSTLNSIQNRCMQCVGKEKLAENINKLMENRNASLAGFFIQKNIPAERIKISNAKDTAQVGSDTGPKYVINFFAEDSQNTAEANSTGEKQVPEK